MPLVTCDINTRIPGEWEVSLSTFEALRAFLVGSIDPKVATRLIKSAVDSRRELVILAKKAGII